LLLRNDVIQAYLPVWLQCGGYGPIGGPT